MAYPDLWSVLGLPLFSSALTQKPLLENQILDRGYAIELDWLGETRDPALQKQKTLRTWQQQILSGQIPIPIFNATLVEDGRRFLISPMTFDRAKGRQVTDFNLGARKAVYKQRKAFYDQRKGYAPPLSWKLTDTEKQAIEIAWRIVQGQETFTKLQATCQDWKIYSP